MALNPLDSINLEQLALEGLMSDGVVAVTKQYFLQTLSNHSE